MNRSEAEHMQREQAAAQLRRAIAEARRLGLLIRNDEQAGEPSVEPFNPLPCPVTATAAIPQTRH